MRDLIGLRVRLLLLPPGLWERLDRKAPEEGHKADARRSLCSVCARDCSPLVRDTIVTQNKPKMRAPSTSALSKTVCQQFRRGPPARG